MGRSGSAGAGGPETPSFRIGAPPADPTVAAAPSDPVAGDGVLEDALPGDEPPAGGGGPELLEADGIRVTELALATAIEGGQPVDPRTTFSKASDERVYCFVRLDNIAEVETSISIGWERADRPSDSPGASLRVPAQERYRTFAFTGTRRPAGRYRCVVRSEGGSVLGRIEFELTE
jgi:hypothetical protein